MVFLSMTDIQRMLHMLTCGPYSTLTGLYLDQYNKAWMLQQCPVVRGVSEHHQFQYLPLCGPWQAPPLRLHPENPLRTIYLSPHMHTDQHGSLVGRSRHSLSLSNVLCSLPASSHLFTVPFSLHTEISFLMRHSGTASEAVTDALVSLAAPSFVCTASSS